MTSVLDRFRRWVGSLVGGDGSDDSDVTSPSSEGGDGASGAEPTPTTPGVAHRDARPLATPGDLDRSGPVATGTGTDAGDGAGEGETDDPSPVEIPDAEAVAGEGSPTAGGATAEDGPRPPSSDEPSTADARVPPDDDRGGDGTGDRDSPRDDGTDRAFACTVCGTTVDDPTAPCPLCRSTDVAPVADGAGGDDGPSAAGRTAVSPADDEAVDRLRDVRGRDR
jgi:hypothetical protein